MTTKLERAAIAYVNARNEAARVRKARSDARLRCTELAEDEDGWLRGRTHYSDAINQNGRDRQTGSPIFDDDGCCPACADAAALDMPVRLSAAKQGAAWRALRRIVAEVSQ